jgi:large subunit ribosomal protein L18
MEIGDKRLLAQKRRWRVRTRIKGTMERPRLSVHFSNRHVYAQCIDDHRAVTLASTSSISSKKVADVGPSQATISGAKEVGEILAAKALAVGIKQVVFDRGPRRYHGCVQAFAEAARGGGLEF